MQPVRPALPEFHSIGFEPITAPVRRQRNLLVTEAFGHFRHPRIEHAPAVKHLALTRCPRAYLATHWTRVKISLRFFARGFLHFSVDANLPVELDPVKRQRRVRIGLQLFPFLAFVIGKKNKPVLIEVFLQKDADRRSAIPAHGGEAHCVDVPNACLDRGTEPVPKLFDRVGIKIAPAQTFLGVLVARGGRISRDFHQDNKSTAQRCAARKLSCLSPGRLGKRDLLLEAFATANA